MLQGHLAASLRMNAFAVPVLAAWLVFIGSTVRATWVGGSPFTFHMGRLGRATLGVIAVVYAGAFGLWALRWFGFFGGPVPVF
jgi:hypothetical protein